MKLVFFGTSVFAVPILERLSPFVSLAVTQPDRPSGRGLTLNPSPIKQCAEALGVPVIDPKKIRTPEFEAALRAEGADAFVVAAYGRILPTNILDIPPHGCLNLHGSILPAYRGAAPIQRCLENGDRVTGVTLMHMDEGMDTGDMIAVVETKIGDDEVYGALQDRLATLAADLAEAWIPRVVAGRANRIHQLEAKATHAAKVEKGEAELLWTEPAQVNHNRFRAFTPSPGAFFRKEESVVRVSSIRLSEQSGIPGTVLALKPNLCVACYEGSLVLLELRPEGRKLMSGSDWANGARLQIGDSLITRK